MANTIVSLFDDGGEAQRLVRELTTAGFDQGSVNTITSNSGDVSNTLRSASVPQDAASVYERGVKGGGTLVTLRVEDDEVDRAMAIINRYNTVDIDERSTQSAGSTTSDLGRTSAQGEAVIPVVEEQLNIGKRQVERGGVRIYSHVTERPVEETVTLREERVHVERHPVNREVTDADAAALREGSFEVTTQAEEAVVAKQARVVEEVVVGKEAGERTETVRDTVRRTEVEVDETGTDKTARTKRATNR